MDMVRGARLLTSLAVAALVIVAAGCSVDADSLRRTLETHPEILFDVIEKNGARFQEAFRKSQVEYQRRAKEEEQKRQREMLEEDLKKPKKVAIDDARPSRGPKNAPILLVTYSDFQCPYCRQGYQIAEDLRKKHGDKIRFVFKHLPLQFHPLAMPAAKRFEAIAMQSGEKAFRFHDEIFQNQQKLQGGEKFLDELARKVGADMARMQRDMESVAVRSRIEADMEEAKRLEIRGTPGFVLNGVVIRGAFPLAYFDQVLERRPKND
jgi:protein-disulfide isomerase